MICFETQIKYNKKMIDSISSNHILKKIVRKGLEKYKIGKIAETPQETLEEFIDFCTNIGGMTRPNSCDVAGILLIATEQTEESGVVKSGFCLNKKSPHYEEDKAFFLKKSKANAHASIPNFTYLEIGGMPIVTEDMDYLDVVTL